MIIYNIRMLYVQSIGNFSCDGRQQSMGTPQGQRSLGARYVVCGERGVVGGGKGIYNIFTGTPQKQRSLSARYIDLYSTYVVCGERGAGRGLKEYTWRLLKSKERMTYVQYIRRMLCVKRGGRGGR